MPNVLRGPGEFEFEEKRLRFIGRCRSIETEEDARNYINEIRSLHKDASHNVYAYGLTNESITDYTRHSDDGEPKGTAGLPVLNVFTKNKIINFVCVVTRYFGGTLLSAGGLTRAYSRAAKGAAEAAGFEPLIVIVRYKINFHYSKLSQIQYFCEKNEIVIENINYAGDCEIIFSMPERLEKIFLQNAGLYTREPPLRLAP